MRLYHQKLHISSPEGVSGDEYRVVGGQVEFRKLDGAGKNSRKAAAWKPLTPADIQMHIVLNTPVAEWLWKRLLAGIGEMHLFRKSLPGPSD